jgi:hypothetical protein
MRFQLPFVLGILSLPLIACSPRAQDPVARSKAVSGAARWDETSSWHGEGALATGGLKGAYQTTVDLRTGRSADAYQLGSIQGADGYDGKAAWSKDPGGEVSVQDTPEAIRRARTQAWLDAHGYWYPERFAAQREAVKSVQIDGKPLLEVDATPQGGDRVVLMFDAASGQLARTAQRQGQDTATTSYDEYTDVGGVRLPFHLVTDLTDAAGRTDPNRRVDVKIEHATRNVAVSDVDFAPPAAAQVASIENTRGATAVPFDLVNNHIYVNGRVEGKPARFLVDTGGVNLLVPAAAKRLGINGEGDLSAGGVGENHASVAVAHAKSVSVGEASLTNPIFYVIDLGPMAALEGVESDGLVGFELFSRFVVRIDYARRQLLLTVHPRFVPPAAAESIPFELDGRVPIIQGVLDGQPVRLTVDTGSRSALTLHSPFVRAHALTERYHAAPESVLGWGVGGPSRECAARFGTLKLGHLTVEGIAGELFTGDKGDFANPDVDGNLGGGVLRRFVVVFDYANRVMYLTPDQDTDRPDSFDRSGLWLLADGNSLSVADVAADSAAARAGLRVNDRITAIGGVSTTRRSLADWRARLRELPVGSRLALSYLRAGQSVSGELVLTDRIPARFLPQGR